MGVPAYSLTPANNNASPPNGWPEGQAPSTVNDCARQMMTDIATEAQTNAVKVLGAVSGVDTITATMSPTLTAYVTGMYVIFTPAGSNATATPTLNINGLGAKTIQRANALTLAAADLSTSCPALCVYSGSIFTLINPSVSPYSASNLTAGTLADARVAASNVTQFQTASSNVGYLNLPQNIQNGSYTTVLTDTSKSIYHASGAGAGHTHSIAANASVAYPLGTVLTFVNKDTNALSLAVTTDTGTLAGTTSTGTRTLAQNGIATAYKDTATSWLWSGPGLS